MGRVFFWNKKKKKKQCSQLFNQTGCLVSLSIADAGLLGCKKSKVYTWDSPALWNCSLLRDEWKAYLHARHGLYTGYVSKKSRILSPHQRLVSFCFFFCSKKNNTQ